MKSTSEFDILLASLINENMVSADVVGGSPNLIGGSVGNTDSYATGDMRTPFATQIQRRKKSKKRKKYGKSRTLAK